MKFDVDVKGEPAPTKTWLLKDSKIKTGASAKVDHAPYNTKLQFLDTSRKDNGVYKLKAENSSGVDEAKVEVLVLGELFICLTLKKNVFYQTKFLSWFK